MMDRNRYIVRKVDKVPKERSTCGFRKRLITKEAFEAANVTFPRVYEAERQYHNKTTD